MKILFVFRTPLRNALDPANGLNWNRDIFKKPTQQEIRTGAVEVVNLLNPQETGLVELTLGEILSISLRPYPVDLAAGVLIMF